MTEIMSSNMLHQCGIFKSTLNWISVGKSIMGTMGGEGGGERSLSSLISKREPLHSLFMDTLQLHDALSVSF